MNSLTCSVRCDLRNEGFDNIFVALCTPGLVQTDFGAHSIGGGPSNHVLPGAQVINYTYYTILNSAELHSLY